MNKIQSRVKFLKMRYALNSSSKMVCISILSQRHILSAVVPVNTTVSHVTSNIIRCSTSQYNHSKKRTQNNSNAAKSNNSNTHTVSIQFTPSTDPPSTSENIQSCFASSSAGVFLGTVLVQIVHLGTYYPDRALIDSGSEGSFISEKLFSLLRLPFKTIPAQISGLNNGKSAICRFLKFFFIAKPRRRGYAL